MSPNFVSADMSRSEQCSRALGTLEREYGIRCPDEGIILATMREASAGGKADYALVPVPEMDAERMISIGSRRQSVRADDILPFFENRTGLMYYLVNVRATQIKDFLPLVFIELGFDQMSEGAPSLSIKADCLTMLRRPASSKVAVSISGEGDVLYPQMSQIEGFAKIKKNPGLAGDYKRLTSQDLD